MNRYVGSALQYQTLINMLGPQVGLVAGGTNFNWGFPFTTRTVVVRNTGTLIGNPKNTTFSVVGYDTVTSMGYRNLSLVAGAIGVAKIPAIGDVGLSSITSMWLPEPTRSSGLLAGAIVLLAMAGWRSRRSG